MPYQAPNLGFLRLIGDAVETEYLVSKNKQKKAAEPSRINLIALLKSLKTIKNSNISYLGDLKEVADVDHEIEKIILGACIATLELVGEEYKGYVYSWIFNDPSKTNAEINRSTFCKLILSKLNITPNNPLSDERRLVYLHAFYKYASFHNLSLTAKDEKSTQSFPNKIKNLRDEVDRRLTPSNQELLKKSPTRRFLVNQSSQLETAYEKASPPPTGALAYFVGNRKVHEKFSKLITMFNRPEMAVFLPKYEKNMDVNKTLNDYTVLHALLIIAMLWVESEYKIRSADNSEFYKLCKQTLNIQSTVDISGDQKKKYFTDLLSVLTRMKEDKATLDFLEKNNLKDAQKFLLDIEKQVSEQIAILSDPLKNGPPTFFSRVGGAIYYTGRIGVGVVAGQGAARACKSTLESGVIKGGATIAGYLVYGTTGALIGAHAGTVLETTIPSFIGQYLSFGMEAAGAAFGHVIGSMVTAAVTATTAGLEYLPISMKPTPQIVANENSPEKDREYIQTLLEIWPEEKRKILLKVVDLEEFEKPASAVSIALK